jgi:hypothetical protein
MEDPDYDRKLAELDQLLNDPDVPMQPGRVWMLLAELASHDMPGAALPASVLATSARPASGA